MTMLVVRKDGTIRLLLNIEIKGDPANPWDPIRARISYENIEGYDIDLMQPDGELISDSNGFVLYPRPTIPPGPPDTVHEKVEPKLKPECINYIAPSLTSKCGIATYTRYLVNQVNKLFPAKTVDNISSANSGSIIHCQHEFGIFPDVRELVSEHYLDSYSVCTWHTVIREPVGVMLEHYHTIDSHYDAHIVHTYLAKKYLSAYTRKPIYVIPHGSYTFSSIGRQHARKVLHLPPEKKIVFLFGFAADSKGFDEIADTAPKFKDTVFIISGAIHDMLKEDGKKLIKKIRSKGNVVVLGKFLSEDEIDLYSAAADCLLFNYRTPDFISSASGALHRVMGSGTPIVCTYDNRMSDLEDGTHALKYSSLEELETCLDLIFNDKEVAQGIGENAKKLAEKTSWYNIARMHIDVYNKIMDGEYYIGEVNGKYYDKKYFADIQGKKFRVNGRIESWGYRNPYGTWEGCEYVVRAWKKLFSPRTMLDAGCGRGAFVAQARKDGIKAYGFDFSEWAINEGRVPECRAEWLRFHDARLKWPYRNREFDLVVMLDTLEHIYEEDLDRVIDEMCRVAGKYIFLEIATTEESEEGYILKKNDIIDFSDRRTWAGHTTVCSRKWWRNRLKKEGWSFRDDLVKRFIEIASAPVLQNWLSNTMLVIERK